MIFTFSKRQLRKLAVKVRMVTKVSFKVRKKDMSILTKYFFEAWHKETMVIEEQHATPRI